jgi:hypothetical protein
MEACSLWLPLMCFSRINNLPYSCKYLHLCAEANQWLMYLIFAQLYQIPRTQVTFLIIFRYAFEPKIKYESLF